MTTSHAKPIVRPVRKVSPRIGRVYVWSARAPIGEGNRLSVDYLFTSIRAYCAKLN